MTEHNRMGPLILTDKTNESLLIDEFFFDNNQLSNRMCRLIDQ